MSAPQHRGPGARVPAWVEAIETACFGKPWGPLDDGEHLWAIHPAGFARWRVVAEAQEAELLRIGVLESARRSGIGRALLRHGQERLTRLGIQVLHLEVRVGNRAARGLYESEGWVYQGLRKGYYRDGEDAALYRFGEFLI